MKTTLRNIIRNITDKASREKKVLNELRYYSSKYDAPNKFFIGAYELHLFTGIDMKVVRRALQSLERKGLVTSAPRYLNGMKLNTVGYIVNE